MTAPSASRRGLLRTGAGLLATATLAGCTQIGVGRVTAATATQVPTPARRVAFLDLPALLGAAPTRALVDAALGGLAEREGQGEGYTGPTDYDEAVSAAEERVGLAPGSLGRVVVFWDASRDPYVGLRFGPGAETYIEALLEGGSDPEALVERLEGDGGSFRESRYRDRRVYEQADADRRLAVLADGSYVLGAGGAALDLVDIDDGAGSVDEALARAFRTVDRSPFRVAVELPPDPFAGSDEPLLRKLGDAVSHVAGSLRFGDGRVRAAVHLSTERPEAAARAEERLSALLTLIAGLEGTAAPVERLLQSVTVDVTGRVVRLRHAAPVATAAEQLRAVVAGL